MGIKKGYPRVKKRYFGKLAAYIQLLRPFTLFAAFLAGLFGTVAPVGDITFTHLIKAIYVGATLAFAQGCGQCLNQYADVEIDKIIKGYRPLPSGTVTREEALGLSWLLALLAIGRGFTISVFFGLMVLVLLFFAVFYSLAPFSPRRINPILNVGWMAISRGFLPFVAVFSIYGNVYDSLKYALLGFIWVFAYQSTKDINDTRGDAKFGIKTIPLSYGLRGLTKFMVIVTILFYLFAVYFELLLVFLLLPLSLMALIGMKKQIKGAENNLGWIAMYTGLGMLYVLVFMSLHL